MSTSATLPPVSKKSANRLPKGSYAPPTLSSLTSKLTLHSGVIAEKANETLFSLDLGGSTAITKKEKLGPRLKSDEILAARSAVPGVSAKRRNNDAIGSGIYERKKKRIDGVSHAHLQRLRMTAYGKSSAPVKKLSDAPNFDPWDEDVVPAPVDPKQSFLEFIPPPKPPTTLKHEPISLSTSVKMPAVRVPDAGISYNPEFAKWDALLREEGEKEVEHEKARLAGLAEEARIQILREEPDVESAVEDSESEEEESVQSGDERVPVDQSRKTQTQRNKEARAKAQERERMEARKQKIAERELLLIKKHAKDVKAQERIRMARLMEKMAQKPDDEKDPKIMRKKRFGKIA